LGIARSGPAEGQPVDLSQQRGPLIPSDPRIQGGIGPRPTSVRFEDRRPRGGEVAQFLRFSNRHPKQLGKEVAQICRGIPASTLIEIEDHDAPISPEQVGRTEVAVHERGDLGGGGASRSSDANAFCSESASVGNRPQRSRMRGRMSSTKSAGEIVRAGAMGRAWSVANARPIATKIGSVSRAIAELTDSPGSYVSRRN